MPRGAAGIPSSRAPRRLLPIGSRTSPLGQAPVAASLRAPWRSATQISYPPGPMPTGPTEDVPRLGETVGRPPVPGAVPPLPIILAVSVGHRIASDPVPPAAGLVVPAAGFARTGACGSLGTGLPSLAWEAAKGRC